MDYIIVEFQGFRNNEDFIVKELVMLNNNFEDSFLFKPPFEIEELSKNSLRDFQFVERYHGFKWNDGNCAYDNFPKVLKDRCETKDIIFTKGYEKAKFLAGILEKPVYNLNKILLTKFENLRGPKGSCIFGNHSVTSCAYINAHKIQKWIYDVQDVGLLK